MVDMAKPKENARRMLSVRNMDSAVVDSMKRAANARGMGLREYIEALVELHQRVRGVDDARIARILKELKLGEVTL